MSTILDPRSPLVQAVILRSHCRLMAVGMAHSRLSKTKVLQMAGAITGETYKRGQHEQAAEDLLTWADAENAKMNANL